jgi:hypothetical protein
MEKDPGEVKARGVAKAREAAKENMVGKVKEEKDRRDRPARLPLWISYVQS